MRTFVIADASKRKAKPIATLIWEDDPTNNHGRFALEVSSRCKAENLPLSLSFCAGDQHKTASAEESEAWVRSRIVPENRQNIVEVLQANGLAEYDEVNLLAASKGRSSDDDYLAYEVEIPDSWLEGLSSTDAVETEGTLGIVTGESRADRIISAVERRRQEGEIIYAFVALPSDDTNVARSAGHSAVAQSDDCANAAFCIATQIRERRIQAGLTQKQLAAKASITQSVLSRIESGKGNPTLSLLEDLAAALDANLDVSLVPHE